MWSFRVWVASVDDSQQEAVPVATIQRENPRGGLAWQETSLLFCNIISSSLRHHIVYPYIISVTVFLVTLTSLFLLLPSSTSSCTTMSRFVCRKDGEYCDAHGDAPPGCAAVGSSSAGGGCRAIAVGAGGVGGFQNFAAMKTAGTRPAAAAAPPRRGVEALSASGHLEDWRTHLVK